jgi:hypothetical protein
MGLVDRLFTRILSQEAASALGLSSFTIDVNAIGAMCRHATPRSLLLIDEFGKGTNCIDGVSLLCATVRYFLKSQNPPKCIITTHFRELFDYELLSGSPPPSSSSSSLSTNGRSDGGGGRIEGKEDVNDGLLGIRGLGIAPKNVCFQQMDVRFDTITKPSSSSTTTIASSSSSSSSSSIVPRHGVVIFDENVEPTPMFRLVPGHAASSFGLQCAIKGGIPLEIVKRASTISSLLKAHDPISPLVVNPDTMNMSSSTAVISSSEVNAKKRRNWAALALADLIMAKPEERDRGNTTGGTSSQLERMRQLLRHASL